MLPNRSPCSKGLRAIARTHGYSTQAPRGAHKCSLPHKQERTSEFDTLPHAPLGSQWAKPITGRQKRARKLFIKRYIARWRSTSLCPVERKEGHLTADGAGAQCPSAVVRAPGTEARGPRNRRGRVGLRRGGTPSRTPAFIEYASVLTAPSAQIFKGSARWCALGDGHRLSSANAGNPRPDRKGPVQVLGARRR